MRKFQNIKKVLVLGSGAIKIGEAGEFDYSGSQCLKAIKEEGIKTVLVNPNIATIQTDNKIADKIYFLPVLAEYVSKIIEKERPDGIMLSFGGQTALNCGVELKRKGILDKYGVKVLGTSVETIEIASDREKFRKTMINFNLPIAKSKSAYSITEAKKIAKNLGYPVMIRVAFTLGGKGGGIAKNEKELEEIVEKGLAHSLIKEVLIEEYLGNLKQIEYEIMRDYKGNTISVCNMENMLGMKIHTGDNIVVAPSQTLNNYEYHILRNAAIKVANVVKVIGECNVQFALDSKNKKYYIIEINPRMSRSSALASKATGYPIAYIAAKLALGYTLPEILNKVTKVTTASFEPSLDYLVIKIPKWDFEKFLKVDRRLSTQMKSVGEIMAIGRNFEETIQKAIRMLNINKEGITDFEEIEEKEIIERNLKEPTDEIIFYIAKAIKKKISVERISKLSKIDRWFIYKIKNIVEFEKEIKKIRENYSKKKYEKVKEILLNAKKLGFSDKQIAKILSLKEEDIRKLRKKFKIFPVVKQIDTLAAEWPAQTNYLYLTYNGNYNDIEFKKNNSKIIVIGAGPYKIGSSVEFDWSTMNMVWSLKNLGIKETIVINCNPETVSTDYDMSDKLYFEELTLERILDIYEKEKPLGIIISVGGQIPNNLALKLHLNKVKILGTNVQSIDIAENRKKFSELLDSLKIKQPEWNTFIDLDKSIEFARKVGLPVIIRPSYVLSGSAMEIVWTTSQLIKYLRKNTKISSEYPVTISKFIKDAIEAEVDAVSDGNKVIIGAIIEHIESAGLHSGDSIHVIPPLRLNKEIKKKIKKITYKIAKALKIKGPFNIQFLVKGDEVYVIECNLRASRSMPFTSKTIGINLIEIASEAILKGKIKRNIKINFKHFGVKVPQFSFMQLDKADPILGVEMRSTGEVACFGNTFYETLFNALIAAGYRVPLIKGKVLISVGGVKLKEKVLNLAKFLNKIGFKIYATEHTAEYLLKKGINSEVLYKIKEPERKPNILDFLKENKLDLIINIPSSISLEKYSEMLEDEYLIRRKAIELNIPVLTRIETAYAILEAIKYFLEKNKLNNIISK